MTYYRILTLVFAAFFVGSFNSLSASAQSASYFLEPVVFVGDPVPDIAGATFQLIDRPDINDAGDLAFQGWYQDATSSNQAVWLGQPDALSILAQAGADAPGAPGRTFSAFSQITLNENGSAAFFAFLDQSAPHNNGIWVGKHGSLAPIARGGELAPGAEPRFFIDVDAGASANYMRELNNVDEMVIVAELNQTVDPNNEGIWVGDGNNLRPVAIEGDPAPGTAGSFIILDQPILNDTGDILFLGHIGLNPTQNGAWLERNGVLEPVLKTGDNAPDVPGRTISSVSSNPGLNSAGEIALGLTLDNSDTSNNSGVWVKRNKKFVVVARRGDPIPGVPGEIFRFVLLDRITESGLISLRGGIDDPANPNLDGHWIGREGNLQLVAVEGQEPPGIPGSQFNVFTSFAVNDKGETAFSAGFDSPDPNNNSGVWVGPPGALELVLREGDSVEIRPGDTRTFFAANIQPGGINAQGDVALLAFFSGSVRGVMIVRSKKPVVDAGPDQSVVISSGVTTPVTLDGSGSFDRDGTIVSYVWASGGNIVAEGAVVSLDLNKGSYEFELTATDNDGFTNSDSVNVVVTRGGRGGSCNPNKPDC